MSCPTCDHTMQLLAGSWFWCPRCGTTAVAVNPGHRHESIKEHTITIPSGVQSVRAWLQSSSWVSPGSGVRQHLERQLLHPDEREREALGNE